MALDHDAAADAPRAPRGVTVLAGPEYDLIMDSIEWADKVVAW